ncbi:MAG TPA: ABC transporter ATP-binding protein, partial [Acidimicrobiales bacterium]|nr:ABC transporter ATP-binding protein [Acidimicrobiales bacterium]
MSMFGGGPMWGGVAGGGLGGGGRAGAWGGAGNATQGGAPFAGIPPELADAVTGLVATEPDHGEPDAVFTQRVSDTRPLTVMRMIADRWRLALLSVVLLSVETVGFQTGPYLTQVGIDDGLVGPHRHLDVIVTCGLVYLVTVVLTVFVERARVRNTGKLAAQVMNDLRVRVYAHIQRLSLDFFTDEKAGVIMTRMTSDIEVLQQLLQDGLAQFAIQGLTMLFVTAVLFSYNWKLALITIAIVMPALVVASLWFRAASERAYLRVRDSLSAVIADIAESLSGVRVVASYNRQRNNVVHHRNVLGAYRAANFKTARVTANYSTVSDFIGLMGQLSLLLIGGTMVLHSWHRGPAGTLVQGPHPELTIGQLTAFVLYLGSLFQPIQQLVQLYNTYQQGQAAVTKLRGLLAMQPTVQDKPEAYDLPPIQGAIELEHVDFSYVPGDLILRDVNIAIRAGEVVAFVGATGAGKSTIAKLVTRFYDPSKGRVTIDGHDLTDVTLGSLRRQLGVVPQEPFLFTGTIRDNVAFARPGATAQQVREAVDAVGLADLVDRLPDGLETTVHERGQSLSSGERQLMALARAFLAAPRVLILDEATSNLDLKSEAKVERALDRVLQGRTAILIAHRLTTAMRADRIVVIDDGRIVEVGPHDELVAAGGRYAEMFETWTRQHTDERDGAAARPETVARSGPA